MAIEGPLKELSVQDVMQLLDLTRKTGVLRLRSQRRRDTAALHFKKGAITSASRRRSPRRLGQQLLRAGKLTEGELEHALELQKKDGGRRIGEILLEMGCVSEEVLNRQIRFQIEEAVYDVMGWESGHFHFEERDEVDVERLAVRVRVDSLLMEGARRIDEWSRLEPRIPSLDAVPALNPLADDENDTLDLRPDEWEVLAEIDGKNDIRQIATGLGRSTFDVATIVYGLVTTGVAHVAEGPARMQEHELSAAIAEIEKRLDAGEMEAASRLAADLRQTHPKHSGVALLIGRIMAAQGRMQAATETFANAVGLDPLDAEAHYRLGLAAVRVGELDRAEQAWTTYLRLNENGSDRTLVRDGIGAIQALNKILEQSESGDR